MFGIALMHKHGLLLGSREERRIRTLPKEEATRAHFAFCTFTVEVDLQFE